MIKFLLFSSNINVFPLSQQHNAQTEKQENLVQVFIFLVGEGIFIAYSPVRIP